MGKVSIGGGLKVVVMWCNYVIDFYLICCGCGDDFSCDELGWVVLM